MLVSPLHNHPVRWWCEIPCRASDGTPILVVVGCDAYDGTPWTLGVSALGTRGDAAVKSAWDCAACWDSPEWRPSEGNNPMTLFPRFTSR